MRTRAVGVVLMAYGTPTGRDDVERYYTDIRRGRPPTDEQLADLVSRYDAIGGVSPLADRTEAQRAALQRGLDERNGRGRFEVVLGMKHSSPTIGDAVRSLADRGVRRAVGLVLAPHFSALSVGEYMERLTAAATPVRVKITPIESWHLEPAYLDFCAATVKAGLAALPAGSPVVFTAHSLPERILATGDPYPAQLHETAAAAARLAGLGDEGWTTAWQSAGRTPEPWLGPDIGAVISELAAAERPGVLVCACGFVADHLELLYDLDIEARCHAESVGIAFARTPAVNDDPDVMAALAGLVAKAAT